jgi:hypothetical protein
MQPMVSGTTAAETSAARRSAPRLTLANHMPTTIASAGKISAM